jgi:hypothetical protein
MAARVARARCSALLTEATVVSSRQVLQRRDEGQPHRLAGDRALGRVAVLGQDRPVEDRLDPRLGRPRGRQ